MLLVGATDWASNVEPIKVDSSEPIMHRSLSLDTFEPPAMEWNKTYGGLSKDSPGFSNALVQTDDGGYAMAGYTASFEDPDGDFYLVKTDTNGNMQWNKTYGTIGMDAARAVVQTSDGGYTIAGTIWMGTTAQDLYLIKTDSLGTSQWSRRYGGTKGERVRSMIETSDGGYAIAGGTYSFGAGYEDFWLVKTDAWGNMQWNKTYGGAAYECAYSVVQTRDGGYALAGWTNSFGAHRHDFWLVKTDASGNTEWSKMYGGEGDDQAGAIVQTDDNGFVVAGSTGSFGAGWYDIWLVKTDSSGSMQWNKTYGGTESDQVMSVIQTNDGGYALIGITWSFDAVYNDPWLIKTDVNGNMQWDKIFEGQGNDYGHSVIQTRDGGYALLCLQSQGHPNYDFWLIKLITNLNPITLPSIEKLPFKLSLEPVNGEWKANTDYKMILWECFGRHAEILASLLVEEPFDQIAKVWVFFAADKDGDGKLSAEEWNDVFEKLRPSLAIELVKYITKYHCQVSSQVAYELGYTVLDGLAKLGELAKEYLPLVVGGVTSLAIPFTSTGYIMPGNMFGVLGIQFPIPEWMATEFMLGYGTTKVQAMSPVDLSITDSLCRVVNKTQNDIPGARYVEIDLNDDGENDDLVILPDATSDYVIEVIPEPESNPNDTYTLIAGNTWAGLIIEENNTIQNIPDGGYTSSSYGENFLQAIPPMIELLSPQNKTYYSDFVPLIAEFGKAVSWIGYSLDNQPNVTVSGNTIINVDDGKHQIVVYANDTSGNMGYSEIVYFSVDSTFYDPWKTGFIGLDGYPIVDFAVYNGELYAAADNVLYVYNGSSWSVIHAPTFVVSLEAYEDKLIVGGKGGLYSFDETTFTLILPVSSYIKVLGVYNSILYAGTILDKPPTLYYCNGSTENPGSWHKDTAFSTVLNFSGPFGNIDSFAAYDNDMYLTSGGIVYSYNGTDWNIIKTYTDVRTYLDMKAYNGKLYLATRDQAWRKPVYQGYSGFSGRVIEFDGNNWTVILDHDYWLYSLETYHGRLYAGTANKIFEYNMTDWNLSFSSINPAQYAISFEVYDDKLFAGMGNGNIYECHNPTYMINILVVDEYGNPVGDDYEVWFYYMDTYLGTTNEHGQVLYCIEEGFGDRVVDVYDPFGYPYGEKVLMEGVTFLEIEPSGVSPPPNGLLISTVPETSFVPILIVIGVPASLGVIVKKRKLFN